MSEFTRFNQKMQPNVDDILIRTQKCYSNHTFYTHTDLYIIIMIALLHTVNPPLKWLLPDVCDVSLVEFRWEALGRDQHLFLRRHESAPAADLGSDSVRNSVHGITWGCGADRKKDKYTVCKIIIIKKKFEDITSPTSSVSSVPVGSVAVVVGDLSEPSHCPIPVSSSSTLSESAQSGF